MFHINAQSDVPVYRQLVDELRSAIRSGRLDAGAQLPTVLAMAEDLGLARGTIKRAYDELSLLGRVEKIQGRGTFVCYRPPSVGDRKEQAMALIDRMLAGMGELGFSTEEIGIFLELKLRERAVNAPDIKVAIIESSSENLSQMARQLRRLEGVEVYSYLVSHAEAYPYNLEEEADLIVTTGEHACQLKNLLPQSDKIARVALRLSLPTMAEIIRLQPGERVGVLGCSQRFGDLLFEACAAFAGDTAVQPPVLVSRDLDLPAFLSGKDAVLVPEDLEKYLEPDGVAQMRRFARRGQLIPCAYEIDEGSFLYLQEKIELLRQRK